MTEKSNSLTARGYVVTALVDQADAKGLPFVFEVKSKKGTPYFIKQLKDGKLRAFRTKEAKDTTTIAGMFAFTKVDTPNGVDLVGEVFKSVRPRGKASETAAAPAAGETAPAAEPQKTENAA